MGQFESLASFLHAYVHKYLPNNSGIHIKRTMTSNIGVTMFWEDKQVIGYLIAGPKGYDVENVFKQLQDLRKKIPGLETAWAMEYGEKRSSHNHVQENYGNDHYDDSDQDDISEMDELYDEDFIDDTQRKSVLNKYRKAARHYLLNVISYPFEDRHITAFTIFTMALSKDLYENGTNKFFGKLKDILKSINIPRKYRQDLVIDLHEVLTILSPAEFTFWMVKTFGIQVEKGMDYVSNTFYYE